MNLPLVFITQKKIGDELRAIYRENLGGAAELLFAAGPGNCSVTSNSPGCSTF